jgi:LacI family transcriptional regulator
MDYHMVGVLAANWLCEQGCRNLVAVIPDNPVANMREVAFEEQARKHGSRVTVVRAVGVAVHAEDASALVSEIGQIDPLPDGLFAFNDHTLLAIHSGLVKGGFDVENGFRMIGCDAEQFVRALSPQPATIDTHIPDMARRAAETLLWRIGNPTARPVTVMLRPQVVAPALP